jgi:hypothetical protein
MPVGAFLPLVKAALRIDLKTVQVVVEHFEANLDSDTVYQCLLEAAEMTPTPTLEWLLAHFETRARSAWMHPKIGQLVAAAVKSDYPDNLYRLRDYFGGLHFE